MKPTRMSTFDYAIVTTAYFDDDTIIDFGGETLVPKREEDALENEPTKVRYRAPMFLDSESLVF
jgi:hypothetical protein